MHLLYFVSDGGQVNTGKHFKGQKEKNKHKTCLLLFIRLHHLYNFCRVCIVNGSSLAISPPLMSSNKTVNDISVCLYSDRVKKLTTKPPQIDKTQINHTHHRLTHMQHIHTYIQRSPPDRRQINHFLQSNSQGSRGQ